MPKIKADITNSYADGVEIETTASATVEAPPDGDLSEWWQEEIFPLTGAGRDANIDAIYEVWITESSDARMVGWHYEFG